MGATMDSEPNSGLELGLGLTPRNPYSNTSHSKRRSPGGHCPVGGLSEILDAPSSRAFVRSGSIGPGLRGRLNRGLEGHAYPLSSWFGSLVSGEPTTIWSIGYI